jgi:hypothetical protein
MSKTSSAFVLEYKSLYDKELKPWHAIDIADLELTDAFNKFDQGTTSAIDLCRTVLEALFNRDFSGGGSHWSHDGQSVQSKPSADPNEEIFYAEESSTWDWKDIYAVAKSRGTFHISRAGKYVKIVDYSFYTSG